MAHTEIRESKRFAQYALEIPCNLCESLETVYWYCKDCLVYLCRTCQQAHTRIPNCLDHSVVSVREDISSLVVKLICTEHRKPFQCFCKTCNKSICINCLTNIHKLHDFIGLSEHVRSVKDVFASKLQKKQTELQNIQQQIKDLDSCRIEYVQQMCERETEIRQNANGKRQEIAENEAKTLKELEKEKRENCEKIDSQQSSLKDMEICIKEMHDAMTEQLEKDISDQEFLHFVADAEPKLDSVVVNSIIQLPNTPKFVPGITSFAPSKTFGCLVYRRPTFVGIGQETQTTDKQHSQLSTRLRNDIKIMSKFKVKGNIRSIAVADDKKAWIGNDSKSLYLVDFNGKLHLKVKLTEIPWYTTVKENGDLLVSVGTKVKCVNKMGKISDFSDLAPCRAVWGIVYTKQKEVFACVNNDRGRCKIVKLGNDGNIMLEINSDVFPNSRFLHIITAQGDLHCVLDDADNMVYLDRFGTIAKYVKRAGSLTEVGNIAFGGTEYIIGGSGNSLIIMDLNGTCLQMYCISDILNIETLAVSDDQNVWVGTDNGIMVLKFLC